MARAHTGLRIALFGKTGSGKSTVGNIILGSRIFTVGFSPQAITQTCENKSAIVDGRRITVIDTPGLFNTSMSEKRMRRLMERCATLSFPGLHAFLLVIRLDVGLTEEEMNIVGWIKTNFGEDATRYTIILFTHADQLNGQHLDDFIRESRDLQTLINTCGGRYHALNTTDTESQDQVTDLIEMIDRMVQRNRRHHSTAEAFRVAWEQAENFRAAKKQAENVRAAKKLAEDFKAAQKLADEIRAAKKQAEERRAIQQQLEIGTAISALGMVLLSILAVIKL